jgi:putative peptidoglycan lipid II flippase
MSEDNGLPQERPLQEPESASSVYHREGGDSSGGSRRPERTSSSLGRPAVVMAAGTALSRLTGLGRFAAMTYAIGVTESRFADAYNIANTLPNVVYELILGGVLTSVFLPVLVEDIKTAPDDREASLRVSALFVGTMGILMVCTAAAILAAPWIIALFSFRLPPGQRELQQAQATYFFRFFALEIIFYGYTAITAGILNAYHRFAATAFAPVANNVVVIATFLLAAQMLANSGGGLTAVPQVALAVLAVGTTAGVAAMAACQWPAVRRLPLKIGILDGIARLRDSSLPKLLRLSGWIFGLVVTNQVGFGIALVLANAVQGGPTAYFVAFAFFQLPYGLIAVSIVTAVIPTVAGLWVDRELDLLATRLVRAIRASVALLAPATFAAILLAVPGVGLLLEHGVMTPASSQLVSSTFVAFAVGIIPFSLWVLAVRTFYAMQDTRTPFFLNLIEVGATVALDFALYPKFRIVGLAAAHTAGYWLGAALALATLFGRIGARNLWSRLVGPSLATTAAAAGAGAVGWAATKLLFLLSPGALADNTDVARIAHLLAGGAGLSLAFVVIGKLAGVRDIDYLLRIFRLREVMAEVAEAPVARRVAKVGASAIAEPGRSGSEGA